MVVHQAVGVADPMIPLMDMLQHVQKVDAVLIVSENSLLFVAAGGEVIDSTCVLYAKGARHAGTLAQKRGNVKTKDLTPITARCATIDYALQFDRCDSQNLS